MKHSSISTTTSSRRTRALYVAFGAVIGLAACGPEGCCTSTPPDVQVTDARVRSCDIVLRVDGDEVPAVEFDAEVRGQSVPKAPRLGVSFAARTDTAITAAPFQLRFKGAGTASIDHEECFDADGKKLDGTPVVIQ